ncbi:hypothetical protein BT69DRAFT_984834 [Atractiella rhizophila]|nr:hypothetical protein BT69DRAFT_984834 [Atractiella rhizophila]
MMDNLDDLERALQELSPKALRPFPSSPQPGVSSRITNSQSPSTLAAPGLSPSVVPLRKPVTQESVVDLSKTESIPGYGKDTNLEDDAPSTPAILEHPPGASTSSIPPVSVASAVPLHVKTLSRQDSQSSTDNGFGGLVEFSHNGDIDAAPVSANSAYSNDSSEDSSYLPYRASLEEETPATADAPPPLPPKGAEAPPVVALSPTTLPVALPSPGYSPSLPSVPSTPGTSDLQIPSSGGGSWGRKRSGSVAAPTPDNVPKIQPPPRSPMSLNALKAKPWPPTRGASSGAGSLPLEEAPNTSTPPKSPLAKFKFWNRQDGGPSPPPGQTDTNDGGSTFPGEQSDRRVSEKSLHLARPDSLSTYGGLEDPESPSIPTFSIESPRASLEFRSSPLFDPPAPLPPMPTSLESPFSIAPPQRSHVNNLEGQPDSPISQSDTISLRSEQQSQSPAQAPPRLPASLPSTPFSSVQGTINTGRFEPQKSNSKFRLSGLLTEMENFDFSSDDEELPSDFEAPGPKLAVPREQSFDNPAPLRIQKPSSPIVDLT